MSSREIILGRIKRNLRGLASKPLASGMKANNSTRLDVEQLIDRFTVEINRVDGEVIRARNHDEAVRKICSNLETSKNIKLMMSGDPLWEKYHYVEGIKRGLPTSSMSICSINNIPDIASINVSVVGAECLIAETGTVVLVASPGQPRTLSLLPETVIVVAEPSQLLLDMESVLRQLMSRKIFSEASNVTFVTGPSRTADIEKTLVKGVHGPKRLVVVLVS